MESYADSKLCQQCMQRRRSRFKSVSESKHKQTRAAYICATASLVISLMAFAMCIGLQTTVVMNEDITQLHSTIKELTHEINVLKYIQSKKDYMPYNQKDKNDNLVRGNRETYSTHKKPYIEQRFEASGLLEVLKNQTESSLNESYTDRKNHKIVKRSRKNRGKKKRDLEFRIERKKNYFLIKDVRPPARFRDFLVALPNDPVPKEHSGWPFIQIEGSGTQVHQTDKNAVTGYWTLPGWLANKNKRIKAARKVFKFDDLNNSGKLRVKKTGVYLVYAQFTLVGNPITGFHVSLAHSSSNTKKILQCTQFVESKTSDYRQPTQSCFTMGVIEIKKDQEIFIQENANNSGANYSNVSYFGLVRIGD